MSSEEGIKVFVRVRPPNERERQVNRTCVEVDTAKNAVILVSRTDGRRQQFVYDKVADPTGSQSEVFETVGKPTSEYVLEGYNSTIFAYGQTGAGKTFTMQGVEDGVTCEDQSIRGLIPRVFEYLFSRIEELKAQDIQVVCKCSYLEIYNEAVTDLLSDSAAPITIRDDPRRGVVIEGAKELPVANAVDTFKALSLGSQNRKVAATCMNKESSRSHSVFTLYVQLKTQKDGVTTRKFARFNLIDLAGSERQKNTNATGDRLKEANNINRSLSALGNVIMALANANGHVPYRDSKLTFMLKDSIGGNSKTCIIACISPADSCHEETLSTLKFVRFAKLVKNVATINQDSSGDLKALQHEVERLKAALRTANAQNHASKRISEEGQFDISESRAEGVSHGSTPVEILLHQSLEREAEARAALSNEKIIIEEKLKLISAQEAFISGAKMALRLKNGYIQRLEQKHEIAWPDQEAMLKVELEEVRKQLYVNPLLIRANIRIAELTRQVEELEEVVEESGAAAKEGEMKRLHEEIEQLADGLRMTMNGKSSAETRVEQLMEEVEDKVETIEHLQVVLHEFEHTSQTKDRELQNAVDENNDLRVQLIEAKEEASQLSNECKQLNSELQETKTTAAKSEAALLQKTMEVELLQAQLAEFKQNAETIVFDFESKIKASALKIESLESLAAASENALKEMTESTAIKDSAVELERSQLQDQIKERANQEALLLGELEFKSQLLEQTQIRNLEMNTQHKIAYSELFDTLNDFRFDFESVSKAVALDIEGFGDSQLTTERRIAEVLESLQISEQLREQAQQQANLSLAEKAAIESQIREAKTMLQTSEQNKHEADEKLRDLQAEKASAECKIEALLVSLDSSEKQRNENMQELKALIFEREGFTSKICELTSRVEEENVCKQQGEIKIQELQTEQERASARLAELLLLLELANSEKAEQELQLQKLRVDKDNAEMKIAELLTAFQEVQRSKKDIDQSFETLQISMDSLKQEKFELLSSFEDTRCASMALIDSFLELNYGSEMTPTPEMSLAEKAAACQLILKLVIADIRKANETEQAFNGQISLLNESIVTSDLEIQRLQSRTLELESSLSSSFQEQSTLTQLNVHLTDQKIELEAKIQSLETIREDLIAQQNDLIKEKDAIVVEKKVLISENARLLDCQTLIQEKLDDQVKLHVDHIKLQNNISELSEQIIAASEALQSSEEARLAAEARSNEFDANIQALQRLLDVQKQVCDDAEIRCQQAEDMLLSEKRRMEGMLSLKAEFEAQILTLQKNLDNNEAAAMESSRRHVVETEQLRCKMELRVSEELAVVNRLSTQVESLKDELSLMRRTSIEADRIRDEQEEKIVSLQSELEVKALKIEELSILSGHLQDGLQAENKRIAEINEHNNLLGSELELVLGKMKSTESALNDSNRLNLQLSDTIKLMQGKLDSIENELEKKSRDSISKIEKAHTIELDRIKNELEHVAKKLATVNAELDQHKAETETFKSENSALLHKLYHELERKKKDLNEAILAAATIEKEKEGLENLLARTEKALKESSTFNEESEATIASLKAALKQESTKLCEATAIRKQLEKHYLRQIEDLLSNRPVVTSQEDSKAHGRRALSVLAGENSLENAQLLSPSCTGDRKTPMKARLRERSRNAYASHLADVIGSPAANGDGASHSEDMDCSVRPQGVTKAKMQR